ncbi:MAG: c-type cytochrome [Planctomycetaceae bacterium]|nr:c-type cytochrome [Planctomycetaceae bacterium]
MRTALLPFLFVVVSCSQLLAQTLEQQLLNESPVALAEAAKKSGDARRGAILFHQVHVGCVKCHAVDGSSNALGPDLTQLKNQPLHSDQHVVESILKPSAEIRKGFETITVVTRNGKTVTGLLVSKDDEQVVVRDPAHNGNRETVATADIEELVASKVSIMPTGIVNQLNDRPQFLDLLAYVLQIGEGGLQVARKLQPAPGLIVQKLPEYEERVDHAGLIRGLDEDALKRGAEIYNRLCINCHGNRRQPGSLPTALRFAEGKFRNGSDPYSMYRTLTHGFGMMVPQMWMVPRQKYDVVHYIRESYVRKPNPEQYVAVTDSYLAGLPKGDTFGPEPVEYAPWSDMNYGPSMVNTFEVGTGGSNFAYKGIAVRLDAGPGGVAKGNRWAIFDHDTMRLAAFWTRSKDSKEAGFINWQGIHFDGRHGTHPRVVGDVQFENPTGPGWAKPGTSSFEDVDRVIGRDERRYGPLPREWAKYRGLHTIGDQTIIEYTVGDRNILERLGTIEVTVDDQPLTVLTRTMSIAPSSQPQTMLVATHPEEHTSYQRIGKYSAVLGLRDGDDDQQIDPAAFNGGSYLQIDDAAELDLTKDFTIAARIRTSADGTIFSKCNADGPWVPGGKAFFVRGGQLTYDIGWVGAAKSKGRVNDGQWHDVAMTWSVQTGKVSFYIDGRPSGGGNLKPKLPLEEQHVAKIGFAAGNFPATSGFNGRIEKVAVWKEALSKDQLAALSTEAVQNAPAFWDLTSPISHGQKIGSAPFSATAVRGEGTRSRQQIFAGMVGSNASYAMVSVQDGRSLALSIPAEQRSENIVVWTTAVGAQLDRRQLTKIGQQIEERLQVNDLNQQIQQTPQRRWPEVVTTTPTIGSNDGPFAIDTLSTPVANPWFARIRLTGHDFFNDADRMAVCSWDGDVWLVTGLQSLDHGSQPELKWQRIASGLFQPLGLKIVDGTIYVTCRDQLVILRDQNGDGETDFYECFNNDHQVTEHFHEFAMGLQRDERGNFYYAKSARHALKAVVPHHGTLLRIPSDGSRTEILANGFRAANGVCLNPDGSFIVTDQEGHWNPKNRINWVREGGFYGNMFGYHDVTDESDSAMEQPLCWITNAFDRSPAELLWIDNKAWGPLNGTLLNLSYGYGKVYVVPHENVDGQMQGGMCELPIPQFPTGIARGRISPHDNGLYLCGMFAWGSNQQTQEGGLYRLRSTGKPAFLPLGISARNQRLQLTFSDPLNAATATDTGRYEVKVWSLKRSANYGSNHYDEHPITVTSATLSADGRMLNLTIPDLAPTWCMEIRCRITTTDGTEVERVIHNTIHKIR